MGDVTMSKMISVASGFQYSVNIGYDLNNDNKLKNFIPTKSALALLEEILMSTSDSSTERSRILIGAYGKGKSHIMLMILSVLLKKDLSLFEKTLPKIAENPKLQQLVENYYEGKNRILPVVITGSNTSLSQAFIHDYSVSHAKKIAVKETLNASNFDNYMYPSRYNDEREMTRYFAFVFIDEDEVEDSTNWIIKSERIGADGVIFAVIPHSEDSIPALKKSLEKTSKDCHQQIFILPKHYQEISDVVHEYEAVSFLRESASDDVSATKKVRMKFLSHRAFSPALQRARKSFHYPLSKYLLLRFFRFCRY